MSLNELEKNEKAMIVKIHAPQVLRQRMQMLGIRKNQVLTLKACSLGKQTIEVEVDSSLVAMRIDEAKKIEIKKIS